MRSFVAVRSVKSTLDPHQQGVRGVTYTSHIYTPRVHVHDRCVCEATDGRTPARFLPDVLESSATA